MKVTIFTFGTHGDIEPNLALAVGLQKAGHQATLVAPRSYSAWIRSYGVRAHPLPMDSLESIERALPRSYSRLQRMRTMSRVTSPGFRQAIEENVIAAQDADFIVQYCGTLGGVEVAESRGIPMAFSYVYPFAPTGVFPSFLLPWRFSFGRAYNRFTQRLMLRIAWAIYGRPLNDMRARRFGLLPARSYDELLRTQTALGAPHLNAWSPSALPKPADWDATQHVPGFWFLPPPADWQPPADLVRFIEDGPPPVFVGFGSMKGGDAERLTRKVLRALELSGQRGVLLAGGGGGLVRMQAPSTVHFIEHASHAWLLPRMAAAVHHGGGTTGRVLRTGIPSIIAPFILDQFAWGKALADLGVSLYVGRMNKLTAEKLAAAIHTAVNDAGLRARAAALGEKIRAENGVERAVGLIERYAEVFAQRLKNKAA